MLKIVKNERAREGVYMREEFAREGARGGPDERAGGG